MSFDLRLRQGDLAINSDGDVEVVENTAKLVQDILKLLSTQLGANRRYPYYGSPITQALIGRPLEDQFIETVATQQLRESLQLLQRLQTEQLRRNQVVTPSEQIAAIRRVRVTQNPIDPRFFQIALTVLNKSRRSVEIPPLDIAL